MSHVSPHTEQHVSDPTILYRVLLKEQDMHNEALTNENAALRAEVRVLQERTKANVFSRLNGGNKRGATPSPHRAGHVSAMDDDVSAAAAVSCSVPSCHRHRTLRRPTLRSSLSVATSRRLLPSASQPTATASNDDVGGRHVPVPAIYTSPPQRDVSTISRISFDMQTQTGGASPLGSNQARAAWRHQQEQQQVPNGGGGSGPDVAAAVSPLPRVPHGEEVVSAVVHAADGCTKSPTRQQQPLIRCDSTTQTTTTKGPSASDKQPAVASPTHGAGPSPTRPTIVLPERAAMTTLLRELLVFVMQDDVTLGRRSEADAVASHITFSDAASSELYRSLRKQIYRLKRRVQHTLTDMGKLQHMVAVYRETSMMQLSSTHQDAMLEMADALHHQQQPPPPSATYDRQLHGDARQYDHHQAERPKSAYARTRPSNIQGAAQSRDRMFDMRVNVEQSLSTTSMGEDVARPLPRQEGGARLTAMAAENGRTTMDQGPGRMDRSVMGSAIGDVSAMSTAHNTSSHDRHSRTHPGYASYDDAYQGSDTNRSQDDVGYGHRHYQQHNDGSQEVHRHHILCNHEVATGRPTPAHRRAPIPRSPQRQLRSTGLQQGDEDVGHPHASDSFPNEMPQPSESPMYHARPASGGRIASAAHQLRPTSAAGGRHQRQQEEGALHTSNDTASNSVTVGLGRSSDGTSSRLLMEAIAQQCSMASAASSRLSVNPLNVDQLCASASSYAGSPMRQMRGPHGRAGEAEGRARSVGSPRGTWLSPSQKKHPPHQQPRGRSSAEDGGLVVGTSLTDSNVSRFSTLRGDKELDRYVQWKRDFVLRLGGASVGEDDGDEQDTVRRDDTLYDDADLTG